MLRLLVDTCVWLDLAKDPKQLQNLQIVEDLIEAGAMQLIVPRMIIDEFDRNKARVVEDFHKSISSTLARAKDIVIQHGGRRRIRSAMRLLNDADYKIPQPKEAATKILGRVDRLFKHAIPFEITADIKLRALDRALAKRAPFHRNKNSSGDALIIEAYAAFVKMHDKPGDRFAFVTLNYTDFSQLNGNRKLPHDDIADYFSKRKSRYFVTLGEALATLRSQATKDWLFEPNEQQPRSVDEIVEATDELLTKIWYDRHQVSLQKIASGREKLVDKLPNVPWPQRKNLIQRDIWEGALRSAAKVEKRFGKENLGPWSKFDWGMMNGKVSALRWVLGDEWDMLDN